MSQDPPEAGATPLGPVDLLRLPDSHDPREEHLARANLRRLSDSEAAVEQAFGPVADVVPAGGLAGPLVVPARGLPSASAILNLVDDLLVYEDMRMPHLTFELTGASVDDRVDMRASYEMMRPYVPDVAQKLGGGAAMLIRWLDEYEPSLWELCRHLETLTGVGCRASGLVLPVGSRVVPAAPDDTDRVVVPLGEALVVATPWSGGVELVPGQGFAYPQGTAVSVDAARPTVVLVFDIGRTRAASLVSLAGDGARYYPLLRADVPADLGLPAMSYAGSIFDSFELFRSTVAQVLGQQGLERAAAITRSRLSNRVAVDFHDVVDQWHGAHLPVRAPHGGGLLLVEHPDGWSAAMAGMRLDLGPAAETALVPFLDGRTYPSLAIEQALAGLVPDARAFVRTLIEVEVLEVVPRDRVEARS